MKCPKCSSENFVIYHSYPTYVDFAKKTVNYAYPDIETPDRASCGECGENVDAQALWNEALETWDEMVVS